VHDAVVIADGRMGLVCVAVEETHSRLVMQIMHVTSYSGGIGLWFGATGNIVRPVSGFIWQSEYT
jgi:hypothetical protein